MSATSVPTKALHAGHQPALPFAVGSASAGPSAGVQKARSEASRPAKQEAPKICSASVLVFLTLLGGTSLGVLIIRIIEF